MIKSKIQTDSLDSATRKYRGWMDCMRQTVRVEGITGLYRGMLPCMLRAAPVNGAPFCLFHSFLWQP
jgi:solute carrier family 25 carnitine/acylcarnitine transporter 20/29